jgi:hypothetical protein
MKEEARGNSNNNEREAEGKHEQLTTTKRDFEGPENMFYERNIRY